MTETPIPTVTLTLSLNVTVFMIPALITINTYILIPDYVFNFKVDQAWYW